MHHSWAPVDILSVCVENAVGDRVIIWHVPPSWHRDPHSRQCINMDDPVMRKQDPLPDLELDHTVSSRTGNKGSRRFHNHWEGPFLGWKCLLALSHLRHYAKQAPKHSKLTWNYHKGHHRDLFQYLWKPMDRLQLSNKVIIRCHCLTIFTTLPHPSSSGATMFSPWNKIFPQ